MGDGTTLRFSVEIAQDQAEGALKALTVAFDQAGIKANIALNKIGQGAKHTDGLFASMSNLKREALQHGRVFGFYGQQLASVAGITKGLGTEIAGVGIALASGMWVVAAIEGAKLAVSALEGTSAETEKTKKKLEELAKAADTARIANERRKAEAAGINYDAVTGRSTAAEIMSYQQAETAAYAKGSAEREALKQEYLAKSATTESKADAQRVLAIQSRLEALDYELRVRYQRVLTYGHQIDELSRDSADVQAETGKKVTEKLQTEYERRYKLFYGHLDRVARASEKAAEEEQKRLEKHNDEGQKALDHRARTHEKNAEDGERALEKQAADAERWGTAIGTVMGNLATGQATLAQSFVAIGQLMIKTVVDTAIASVTASAAKSGAEAASSQAGIPVVGPVLAIAAMGTMVSAVLGLLGNIRSASGGFDVGNFAPVTQLHPREMVLPAQLADRVRGMTGGGRSAGAVININAFDTQSVGRGLTRSDSEVMRSLRKMQRRIG